MRKWTDIDLKSKSNELNWLLDAIYLLLNLIYLLSKIQKEERNKERLKDEQSKIEDELSSTNTIYENTVKSSGSTSNDQEKEMKRLEQRESVLKVPTWTNNF